MKTMSEVTVKKSFDCCLSIIDKEPIIIEKW